MGWMRIFKKRRHDVYKCDSCSGTGTLRSNKVLNCEKCHGSGKLDWVEKIVGKKSSDPTQVIFNDPDYFKLFVLEFDLQTDISFKTFLKYLRGFDIFLKVGKFSIPFLKTIVLLNVLVWIILYFGVK